MNTTRAKNTFRAFKNRNYLLFFSGQSVSQIGTWMQRTGVTWLVYSATNHSNFMLGLTIFASQFPSFLFSLLGGIISDRYNRYKILLFTQAASMVQAILLAILTLTGHYAIWQVLALSALLGVINAFDVPARQPLIHEMVNDKEDLPNALALNSSINNLARMIGPGLSGIVLVTCGAGICFLLNAVSFVAVLVCLLLMKFPPHVVPAEKKKIASQMAEGIAYLKQTPSISIVLLMLSFVSLLVLPYDTLFPAFATEVFKGNAATFGSIGSFTGLGAIVCAIFLASLKPRADLKIILLINSIILGLGLILFSHMHYFPVAMLFAMLFGFGAMSQTTICITIVQVHTDKNMRGRVMSFVAMAFFGMLPLGSLLTGFVSAHIGPQNTLLFQGIISLIIALVFSRFLRKDRLSKKGMEQLEEAENEMTERI